MHRSDAHVASLFRGMPLMILCRLLGPRPRRAVWVEVRFREFCIAYESNSQMDVCFDRKAHHLQEVVIMISKRAIKGHLALYIHTFEAAQGTDLAEGCKSVLLAGYTIYMSQKTDMPDDRFQICPMISGILQSLRGMYVCTGRKIPRWQVSSDSPV